VVFGKKIAIDEFAQSREFVMFIAGKTLVVARYRCPTKLREENVNGC
jgi:hypothetical protein